MIFLSFAKCEILIFHFRATIQNIPFENFR